MSREIQPALTGAQRLSVDATTVVPGYSPRNIDVVEEIRDPYA